MCLSDNIIFEPLLIRTTVNDNKRHFARVFFTSKKVSSILSDVDLVLRACLVFNYSRPLVKTKNEFVKHSWYSVENIQKMTECECSVREEKRTPCQFLKFLAVILTGLIVCAFLVVGAVMVRLSLPEEVFNRKLKRILDFRIIFDFDKTQSIFLFYILIRARISSLHK